ncbi:MAG: SpoIIE family protein phosphatase [Tepidisphaeraceae bacterium]
MNGVGDNSALVLDVFQNQFNKSGEELCGDTVKTRRTPDKSIVVLSDGLGSGVKAKILSTLTAEILTTMLEADAPLDEVVRTVLGTLPICKVRQMAYAAFLVLKVDHRTRSFRVVNFDSPPPIFLRGTRLMTPDVKQVEVQGRKFTLSSGELRPGDFIALLSDGTAHAGLGNTMNFGWGWERISTFIRETALTTGGSAPAIVRKVIDRTAQLYGPTVGDDATFIGVRARLHRAAVLFTGPPLDMKHDNAIAQRVVEFPGRRIVCGGTTGNIVGIYVGEDPEVDIGTMRRDVPPIASLRHVDLMTEGILTMTKALELMRSCGFSLLNLSTDNNGAALLRANCWRWTAFISSWASGSTSTTRTPNCH